MNIQFFVCFHKQVFNIYDISLDNEKYLTFYGVKEKIERSRVIYEYELPHYNDVLQKKDYNEGSCIYHVYKNNLYTPYDYVGFCQYDMSFSNSTFKHIESNLGNTIFYLDFFNWAFLGGQSTIIKNYPNIPAGLKNYNEFFNTKYTPDDLIKNKMIVCNTFLIPKKMYEKMMSWLIHYFKDIEKLYIFNKHQFNPGHMIEALTGMFLSLEINEGAVYEPLNIKHEQHLKS